MELLLTVLQGLSQGFFHTWRKSKQFLNSVTFMFPHLQKGLNYACIFKTGDRKQLLMNRISLLWGTHVVQTLLENSVTKTSSMKQNVLGTTQVFDIQLVQHIFFNKPLK